jgi:dynein heavy chain 1
LIYCKFKAGPAVEEAKQAVKGIKKQQLTELKSMTSPPALVKLTLEAVCVMLGEGEGLDWKNIRLVIYTAKHTANWTQINLF